MYNPLAPCPECSRHMRVNETQCPFCGTAVTVDLSRSVVPSAPKRLTRAAALVFGASIAVGATSCSASNPNGTDAAVDTGMQQDSGQVVALYGAPAPDSMVNTDAGSDASPGDGAMDAGPAVRYGLPPMGDT